MENKTAVTGAHRRLEHAGSGHSTGKNAYEAIVREEHQVVEGKFAGGMVVEELLQVEHRAVVGSEDEVIPLGAVLGLVGDGNDLGHMFLVV